jgi:integrase
VGALDLDAGRASVTDTLVATHGYAPEASTPKTDAGRRSIALDPETVTALRNHRKAQAAEKLALGPAYEDAGLVFCREDGTPIRPRSFSRMFARHRDAAELPAIPLKNLRHTHATLALVVLTNRKPTQGADDLAPILEFDRHHGRQGVREIGPHGPQPHRPAGFQGFWRSPMDNPRRADRRAIGETIEARSAGKARSGSVKK